MAEKAYTVCKYRLCSVNVNVYRLRDVGARLTKEAIKANGPVAGALGLYERDPRRRILVATLCGPDFQYLLFPMDQAWVKRINERGLLVLGLEIRPQSRGSGVKGGKYSYTRQAWWCEFSGAAGQAVKVDALPSPADARRPAGAHH